MAGVSVTVTGVSEAISKLSRMGVDVEPIIASELNVQHEMIMTIAKQRTPVDTGALRSSGHVIPPKITRGKIQSIGAFGGTSVLYAIFVHENLQVHHRVGQAKFYQSAVQEKSSDIAPAIKAKILAYLNSIAR